MSVCYLVVSGIVAQRLGDDVVLVHPTTDRIFLLNPTAARVWELLSEQRGLDEIKEKLLEEFEGDEIQISREVDRTIACLTQEQFVNSGSS
jgi:Coenzyme PQQ synthesis protein D (PqqD)